MMALKCDVRKPSSKTSFHTTTTFCTFSTTFCTICTTFSFLLLLLLVDAANSATDAAAAAKSITSNSIIDDGKFVPPSGEDVLLRAENSVLDGSKPAHPNGRPTYPVYGSFRRSRLPYNRHDSLRILPPQIPQSHRRENFTSGSTNPFNVRTLNESHAPEPIIHSMLKTNPIKSFDLEKEFSLNDITTSTKEEFQVNYLKQNVMEETAKNPDRADSMAKLSDTPQQNVLNTSTVLNVDRNYQLEREEGRMPRIHLYQPSMNQEDLESSKASEIGITQSSESLVRVRRHTSRTHYPAELSSLESPSSSSDSDSSRDSNPSMDSDPSMDSHLSRKSDLNRDSHRNRDSDLSRDSDLNRDFELSRDSHLNRDSPLNRYSDLSRDSDLSSYRRYEEALLHLEQTEDAFLEKIRRDRSSSASLVEVRRPPHQHHHHQRQSRRHRVGKAHKKSGRHRKNNQRSSLKGNLKNSTGRGSGSSSGGTALYTEWSRWTRCNRRCKQKRRRRCKKRTLCGTALIKEERPCTGWRCKRRPSGSGEGGNSPPSIQGDRSRQTQSEPLWRVTADRGTTNHNPGHYHTPVNVEVETNSISSSESSPSSADADLSELFNYISGNDQTHSGQPQSDRSNVHYVNKHQQVVVSPHSSQNPDHHRHHYHQQQHSSTRIDHHQHSPNGLPPHSSSSAEPEDTILDGNPAISNGVTKEGEEESGRRTFKVVQGRKSSHRDVRLLLNFNAMFYTRWSDWAGCSKTCLTSRYRWCRYQLFCGGAVVREEAYCYTPGDACEQKYKEDDGVATVQEYLTSSLEQGTSSLEDRPTDPHHPSHDSNIPHHPTDHSSLVNDDIRDVETLIGRLNHPNHRDHHSRTGSSHSSHHHNRVVEPTKRPRFPDVHEFDWNKLSSGEFPSFGDHRHSSFGSHHSMNRPSSGLNDIWKNSYNVESKEDVYDIRELQEHDNPRSSSSFHHHGVGTAGGNGRQPSVVVQQLDRDFGWPSRHSPRRHHSSHTLPEDDHVTNSSSSSSSSSSSLPPPSSPPLNAVCGVSRKGLWAQDSRSGGRKSGLSLRILGGREAERGQWPWQVVILNRYKEAFCGGVVVGPRWVLTAAHCVRKRLYARLAEHDLAIREGTEMEFRIAESIPHPLYDSTTVDNDVALLRLPQPLDYTPYLSPVCLPPQGEPLPVGQLCTIIGWGKERNTHLFGTDVLHQAEVPIINSASCRTVYREYYITANMFCAGYRGGRVDSCAGDSGGPLMCRHEDKWYVHGITSFGEGCGRRGKYGIYARVSNYHSWIHDVMSAHQMSSRSPDSARRHTGSRHSRRHARGGRGRAGRH